MFSKFNFSLLKKVILWTLGIVVGGWILLNVYLYVTSEELPYQVGDKWRKEKGTLYFTGSIDGHEFRRFQEFFDETITTLVVHSFGGDIRQAILIAEVLEKKNITIVVDGICGSSCANYFFVAGNPRVVKENSFVMYHGGLNDGTFANFNRRFPIPQSLLELAVYYSLYEVAQEYRGFNVKEQELYQRNGADFNIIKLSRKKLQGDRYYFWIPNPSTLEAHGIDASNIWYPQTEEAKQHAIAEVCKKKTYDSYETCQQNFQERFLFE